MHTQSDSYQGTCTVAGSLPLWLRGTLLRTGPGLWEVGTRQLRHMTDGEALRRGRLRTCVHHVTKVVA